MSRHPAKSFLFSTITQSTMRREDAVFAALLMLATVIGLAGTGVAQVQPGTPNWSAYDSHDVDSINLSNLTVTLNIPVMSKSGAFPLKLSFLGGDSYIYCCRTGTTLESGIYAYPLQGSVNDIITENGGSGLSGGWGAAYTTTTTNVACPVGGGTGTATKYSGWYIQGNDDTEHILPPTDATYYGASCTGSFTDVTIDGSGYTLAATGISGGATYTISSSNGSILTGLGGIKDSNGNKLYVGASNTVTDTLGMTALTLGSSGWTWNTASGSESLTASTGTTSYYTSTNNLRSNFGCTGFTDYNTTFGLLPLTELSYPDGTDLFLAYEPTNSYSGDTTGRLSEIVLRTGGTIQYNYNPNSTANDGLNCTYLVPNEITRATSDGTTSYTIAWNTSTGSCSATAACSTTTVVDPGGNAKVYYFSAGWGAVSPVTLAMTEVQTFQNTGTVLHPTYSTTATTTDITCYNTTAYNSTPSTCATASVSLPITSTWVYHEVGGSKPSLQETTFDNYGDVTYSAQYDFGATTPNFYTTIKYGSTATCTAWTGNVRNKPCEIEKQDSSGNKLSDVKMAYDSHGNLLSTSVFNGSAYIGQTTNNSYNPNGTIATSYDPANNETTYAYSSSGYSDCGSGGCSNLNLVFPTKITNVGTGLFTQFTWDATGGVKLTSADANGSTTTYGYVNNCGSTADPFWRVGCVTDALLNAHGISYLDSSNEVESIFSFNSGNSVNNMLTTVDGYGRTIDKQNETGPSSTTWDTVSASYSWPNAYFQSFNSIPCSASTGGSCTTGVNTLYDVLNRPTTATQTGSNGVTTYTYYTPASSATKVDARIALSPAPSGENPKQVQNEYDGLGRLTISCGILSSGGSSCNEANSASGIETAYTYTTAPGSYEVKAVRGSQSKTTYTDSLGRVTQTQIPETGTATWSYYYDSSSAITCSSLYAGAIGQLKASVDPKGNLRCYQYDALNRVTGINANGTTCRHLYYDTTYGTVPSGVTAPTYTLGRLAEASTDNCSGTLITDEWFSYDALGRNTDTWELTPHSGGYYHATDTYNANGAPSSEAFAGNYTTNYGIDGEGRWTSAAIGAANEITSVAYNAAQQPLDIFYPTGQVNTTTTAAIALHATTFNVASASDIVINQNLTVDGSCTPPCTPEQVQVSGISGTTVTIGGAGFHHVHPSGATVTSQYGDYDAYGYDSNTGRMTGFALLSNESGGSLGGTLSWNANSTLEQLAISDGFNSGGTQTCAFVYDDLERVVSDLCGTGSTSYRSTMSYDQYNNITKSSSNGTAPVWPQSGSYSSTTNQLSSSTYDANGSTLTDYFHTYTWDGFNRMSTLDSNTMTYDALGRVVEVANGGAYSQFWYSPIGTKIIMNGTTWVRGHLPMPGGTLADFTTSATYIHHKDWLGSSRLTTVAGAVYTDKAFGAYGEDTAQDFGPATNFNYTGDSQDIETAVYDTPNREYMPFQSRWPNVDPARSGWNAYAYVTNPNSLVDPSGLGPTHGGPGCMDVYDNSPYCTQDRGSGNGPDDISQDADESGEFYWSTTGTGSFGTVGADNGGGAGGSSPLTWLLGDVAGGVGADGGSFSSTDAAPCNADTCVTVNATVDPVGTSWLNLGRGAPCSGPGIPCYLKQIPNTLTLKPGGRYGIEQSYLYVVEDINGQSTAVDSVSELLTPVLLVNSLQPENGYWGPTDLRGGVLFEDFLQLTSLQSDYVGGGLLVQHFTATIGGTTYFLSSAYSLLVVVTPNGSYASADAIRP